MSSQITTRAPGSSFSTLASHSVMEALAILVCVSTAFAPAQGVAAAVVMLLLTFKQYDGVVAVIGALKSPWKGLLVVRRATSLLPLIISANSLAKARAEDWIRASRLDCNAEACSPTAPNSPKDKITTEIKISINEKPS